MNHKEEVKSTALAVADPGVQQVQMHPLPKIQNNKFLAIFEGFGHIKMTLCVSYYLECPSHLYKVQGSYNSRVYIRTPLCIFYDTSKLEFRIILPVCERGQLLTEYEQFDAKAYLISWANPLTFLPRAAENFLGMTKRGLEARTR